MTMPIIDGAALSPSGAIAAAAAQVEQGAPAVWVHGVHIGDEAMHWLQSTHARGWVRSGAPLPTMPMAAFTSGWQAWHERGFVAADAALLALAEAEGQLPVMSWGEQPPESAAPPADSEPALGIYAIVDSGRRVQQVVDAGIGTVQLRIKRPADADAAWHAALRAELRQAIEAARSAGAMLFINDHWRLAAELGGDAVHLGQEDLLALGKAGRAELRSTGLALGISSHAVWELCRARPLAPRYIACGPVWPTTTKDMPWHPQGLDNLGWWCRVAGAPVVAIGGILQPQQVEHAAAAGASGVCVLRGLGVDPSRVLPSLNAAFAQGRARSRECRAPAWPHPSLEPGT